MWARAGTTGEERAEIARLRKENKELPRSKTRTALQNLRPTQPEKTKPPSLRKTQAQPSTTQGPTSTRRLMRPRLTNPRKHQVAQKIRSENLLAPRSFAA